MTIPGPRGEVAAAVAGLGAASEAAPSRCGTARPVPSACPPAATPWPENCPPAAATQFALGWLLGGYRFARYRSQPKPAHAAGLVVPAGCDLKYAQAAAAAIGWSRDLVNTPANELGPAELAAAAAGAGARVRRAVHVTEGEALRRDYPLVHAVGQGERARSVPDRLPLAARRSAARDAGRQGRVL